MAKYASAHRNDMEAIACSIRYAEKLPADFSVVLMQDYLNLEKDYQKKLMMLPEFVKWKRTKGALLNGVM